MNQQFLQTLAGVYTFYEKELGEFAIRVWEDAVSEFDIDDLTAAFSQHLKDPEAGKWLPKPADIIRQLRGNADEQAVMAWGAVLCAARGAGTIPTDGAIGDAVQSLGGLSAIGRADESQNGFLQKRFCDAFKAYKHRRESPPILGMNVKRIGQ